MTILVALAAVLYPTIAGQLRSGQSAAIANQLGHLRDAIGRFSENVGQFPSALSHLTNPLTAADRNSCGLIYSTAARDGWRGPYLAQNISGNFPVGSAVVQNTLTRVNTTFPVANLRIDVTNVDSTTAADIEREFDGTSLDYGSGTILWNSSGTLSFLTGMRWC